MICSCRLLLVQIAATAADNPGTTLFKQIHSHQLMSQALPSNTDIVCNNHSNGLYELPGELNQFAAAAASSSWMASLSTCTTLLKANHSGMSSPPRSIFLNLVPLKLS